MKEHKPRGSFDFRLFAVIYEAWILANLAALNRAESVLGEDFASISQKGISFVELEQSCIADCLGVSVKTVQRGSNRLTEQGFIFRFRGDSHEFYNYRPREYSLADVRELKAIWRVETSLLRTVNLVAHSYINFYSTETCIRLSRLKLKFDGMLITGIPA